MEARASRRYGWSVEERSSNRPRPSGDWKPYKKDEAEEKPQPSGDWKPYERDKSTESKAQAKPSEAQKVEAKPKSEAPRDEQRTESKDRDGQGSDHEPSKVDAMGQDKHREVSGKRYGLSRGRQFLYYGLFIVFVIGAYIGLKAATDTLDKAPAKDPDQAPWSKPNAPGGPLGGFTPKSPDQKGSTDFQ